MKKIVFGAFALAVLLLAGCSSLTVPYMVTDNPVGSKTGEVTESYLFGGIVPLPVSSILPAIPVPTAAPESGSILPVSPPALSIRGGDMVSILTGIPLGGDFSLSSAAANGGITKIATVEIRTEANPFIVKRTLIVTGN
jgi:hypothetical protein